MIFRRPYFISVLLSFFREVTRALFLRGGKENGIDVPTTGFSPAYPPKSTAKHFGWGHIGLTFIPPHTHTHTGDFVLNGGEWDIFLIRGNTASPRVVPPRASGIVRGEAFVATLMRAAFGAPFQNVLV